MASGIRRKSAPSRLVISDVHSDSPCQECILCKSKQHVNTHPLKWKDQSLFTYLRDIEPEMFIVATACICRNCKADLANGKKDPAHYHPRWTARTLCDTPCEVPNCEDPACRSTKLGTRELLSDLFNCQPQNMGEVKLCSKIADLLPDNLQKTVGLINPFRKLTGNKTQAHDLLKFHEIGTAMFENRVEAYILKTPSVKPPMKMKRLQTFSSSQKRKNKKVASLEREVKQMQKCMRKKIA